jgi:acyl-CoA thioester hydrolase
MSLFSENKESMSGISANSVWEHTFQIRVRYADTDKMGIVYNGNYLRFFEIGRTELMRSFGIPYKELESNGYLLPLLEAKVEWKGTARYDDLLDIITRFNPNGVTTRIRFEYQILCEGKEIAVGYTMHTFVRADSFRAVRPPQFFLDKLRKQMNGSNK